MKSVWNKAIEHTNIAHMTVGLKTKTSEQIASGLNEEETFYKRVYRRRKEKKKKAAKNSLEVQSSVTSSQPADTEMFLRFEIRHRLHSQLSRTVLAFRSLFTVI